MKPKGDNVIEWWYRNRTRSSFMPGTHLPFSLTSIFDLIWWKLTGSRMGRIICRRCLKYKYFALFAITVLLLQLSLFYMFSFDMDFRTKKKNGHEVSDDSASCQSVAELMMLSLRCCSHVPLNSLIVSKLGFWQIQN